MTKTWQDYFTRAADFAESLLSRKLRAQKMRRLLRLQLLVDHLSHQQNVQTHRVKGPVAGVAKLKLRRLLQEQKAALQSSRNQRSI